MKKTILVLALVAGLTSFTGNAKAAIITQNLNQTVENPTFGAPGSDWYVFGFNLTSL